MLVMSFSFYDKKYKVVFEICIAVFCRIFILCFRCNLNINLQYIGFVQETELPLVALFFSEYVVVVNVTVKDSAVRIFQYIKSSIIEDHKAVDKY